MNTPRPPTRTGALALLETIIAIAIAAVALLGIMAYYLQTLAPPAGLKESRLAEAASRTRLDAIRGLSYDALYTAYPPGVAVPFSVQGLKPVFPDTHPGSVIVDYTDPVRVRVTVRARWMGIDGKECSITPLTTTLMPR